MEDKLILTASASELSKESEDKNCVLNVISSDKVPEPEVECNPVTTAASDVTPIQSELSSINNSGGGDNCVKTHSEGNITHSDNSNFAISDLDTVGEGNHKTGNSEPANSSELIGSNLNEFVENSSKFLTSDSTNVEVSHAKNYKSVILEDWDVDVQGSVSDSRQSATVGNAEITVDDNGSSSQCKNNHSYNDANNSNSSNCNINNNVNINNSYSSSNNENNNNSNDDDNLIEKINTNNVDNGNDVHREDIEHAETLSCRVESSGSLETSQERNISKPSGISGTTIELELSKVDRKSIDLDEDLMKPVLDKKKNPLKYSNLIVSNQDIVDILDNSVERVCRPIIPAKDIFLSIELTKHLNQKLNATAPIKKGESAEVRNLKDTLDSCKNLLSEQQSKSSVNKTSEDLKTVVKDKELDTQNGSQNLTSIQSAGEKSKNEVSAVDVQNKKSKKKGIRKNISIGDELERTIALRQLRDEFPTTRKRSQTTKNINHIPFLASTVLEKALTSSPSENSGGQRRRPCYLPDDSNRIKVESATESAAEEGRLKKKKIKESGEINIQSADENVEKILNSSKTGNELNLKDSSSPVVRTYSFKRKSTLSKNDIKSALKPFVSASKEFEDANIENIESKPKKQKTAQSEENAKVAKVNKSAQKKAKSESGSSKKRNLELEKLLGDEGAVRMLYDTQHKESSKSPKKSRAKSTLGLKKDLILKTKLVKNAVLRLSNVGSDGISLRGNRRSAKSEQVNSNESETSFITSTPNVILYKPKKKPRAEASRILYRHSSSESFDSTEGCQRLSFDGEILNSTNKEKTTLMNGELFKEKEKTEVQLDEFFQSSKRAQVQKKTKTSTNKLKKLKKKKVRRTKIDKEKSNKDNNVFNVSGSKLIWSNVPVRKSSRPRVISKKYSIWSSTSMDSLSAESLGLKKPKKASQEFTKKFNYKELRMLQHGNLVQIILGTSSTVLKSSFNEQVFTELKEALDFLADEESCTAVLLTSNGTTFCQGIDLNYVLSVEEEDRKISFGNLLNSLREFILCLASYKKPIIAGVHASAIGLGVTLLTYCDIVVCSDTATFYTPYSRLGQISEGAATIMFPYINKNLVTELLWKSEKLSASEALKYGLVSQIIPEERFDEELMLLSKRISLQSAQAMQSMKHLLVKNNNEKIEEVLNLESQLILEHWCSNECINNIIKFLNSGEVQFRHLDVP